MIAGIIGGQERVKKLARAGGAEIRGCDCVRLVLILEGAAPFGFKGAGFVWSSKSLLPRSFLALSISAKRGASLFVIFEWMRNHLRKV